MSERLTVILNVSILQGMYDMFRLGENIYVEYKQNFPATLPIIESRKNRSTPQVVIKKLSVLLFLRYNEIYAVVLAVALLLRPL